MRAIATLDASASCGTGTTALIAPLEPDRYKTAAVVSTKATTTIIQNFTLPVSTAAASSPSATAPVTSAAIMRRFRSKRSAATPAGALSSTRGRNSTAPT